MTATVHMYEYNGHSGVANTGDWAESHYPNLYGERMALVAELRWTSGEGGETLTHMTRVPIGITANLVIWDVVDLTGSDFVLVSVWV